MLRGRQLLLHPPRKATRRVAQAVENTVTGGIELKPEPKSDFDASRTYTPHGAAFKVWGCRDDVIVLDGPAGTGKTRALLEKAHLCAMKYNHARILLLRKVREDLTQSVLTTFEEWVLPENSPILAGPKRSLRQEYVYPGTKARIVVAGLDKPQKVMSSEWDMIIMFEAIEFTEQDFEYLTIRNRNGVMPYQQIIIDCNPASPQHWIWKKVKNGQVTRFKSVHHDNPRLYNQATGELTNYGRKYMEKLDKLTGVRRKRFLEGLWVGAEGAVYEYDPQIHDVRYKGGLRNSGIRIFHHAKVPKSWRKIRSIDFGYTKPFVCQWWAIDEDGRMYLYRELYMSRRLVRDHAVKIVLNSVGEDIEATVADWDAEGRADLERCGIPTVQAFKDWENGKEAILGRMRVAGDGKPRIMFFEDALLETDELLKEAGQPIRTTEEFDAYVYKKQKDGQDKEEPIDEFDHGMDAMRYAVAYVDKLGTRQVTIETDTAGIVSEVINPVYRSEDGMILSENGLAVFENAHNSSFTQRPDYEAA